MASNEMDFGGLTAIFKDVKVNATKPGQSGSATSLSATELGYIDGVTPGTQAASKAVVADANVNTGVSKVTEFHLGASGSEQQWDFSTEVVTTTNVITAAENGKTFILNSATAFVSTLPEVAAGLKFTFIAGATQVTGGNHTIVPHANDDNTIYGEYLVAGATVPASAEGSINWIADTILPGDRVVVESDGTNWYVSGAAAATGAITFTT